MHLNEYVILRAFSKKKPRPINKKPTIRSNGAIMLAFEADEPSGFKIERAELSKKEFFDLPKDPQVRSIAPNIPMKLHEPVTREYLLSPPKNGPTWGIEMIGGHNSCYSGKNITVAVLDTGIDGKHTAFNGINIIEKDFTGEGNGDSNGHGTHVAGTVFGREVDGARIGVASGIKRALIGKVLSSKGDGGTGQITEAIHWALSNGANIISMSLGMDFPGYVKEMVHKGYPPDFATSIALEGYRANLNLFNTLGRLVQTSGEFFQPAIMLAACGNESKRGIDPLYEIVASPPSAAEGILAIGAVEKKDLLVNVAPFSNTKPDMCAPGVGIVSAASGGGLKILSGTSMATPHVTGVAALWAEKLSLSGIFNAKNLIARLLANTTFAPLQEGYDPLDLGAGIVQAPFD